MRIQYKKSDFLGTYDSIVKYAERAIIQGDYLKGIQLIKCAANYQYNLNILLVDERLERLIKIISESKSKYSLGYEYIEGNVILYDSFAWDNRGLTQQYLDALCSTGKYRIMLVHNTFFSTNSANIVEFCKKNGVVMEELGNSTYTERENKLLKIINEFRPQHVLFHLFPFDVLPLITFGIFLKITKYQINITDHAFWLGARSIDYSFEFRKRGASISHNQRGIAKDHLLYLPYYPWQEPNKFEGFPNKTDGKIKVFAGGSLYKIEGGNSEFYKIVKKILEENEDVVFLYAGGGDYTNIHSFIKINHFEERVILLGNRTDINEVVSHIDIFINTYPMIGGLMSQLAAINRKPILTYKSKSVEDIVCIKRKEKLVFETIDDLVDEANKLIKDSNYRKRRGDLMRSLLIDQGEFRTLFQEIFETKKAIDSIEDIKLEPYFYDAYLKRINNGTQGLVIEEMIRESCREALCWKMKINLYLPMIRHKIHLAKMKFLDFF